MLISDLGFIYYVVLEKIVQEGVCWKLW